MMKAHASADFFNFSATQVVKLSTFNMVLKEV
jgi:hypothetical protein